MGRLTRLTAACLALLAWASTRTEPAAAQTGAASVNVLALGEQSQRDSVPRDNRIYARVVTALNEVMIRSGVAVFDETAVTASFTSQTRSLRSDAELIEIAKAVPAPPLDVVLIFEIQARAERQGDRPWWTPRIVLTGRLLDVKTGRVFGRLESRPASPAPDLPPDCVRNRLCFNDAIGDQARPLAGEVATLLMAQLKAILDERRSTRSPAQASPPAAEAGPKGDTACGAVRETRIELKGYAPSEVSRIERHLAALRCRQGQSTAQAAADLAVVLYATGLGHAQLTEEIAASASLWSPPATIHAVGETLVATPKR